MSDEALRSIMGGQMARLVAGEEPAWSGPAPGAVEPALHPLLGRIVTHLITAMGRAFSQTDPDESIALARLACAVGDDARHADVAGATLELLDLFRERRAPPPPGRPFPAAARFLIAALTLARTRRPSRCRTVPRPRRRREQAD